MTVTPMSMQMELELPGMPRRVEAAATKPAVASRSEIGYAQATLSQWWLFDEGETTPELQWPRSIAVYDQMRRTDAQVTSLLEAVTLPIRRTAWRLDPAGARATVVKFVAQDLGLPIVGKSAGKAPARTKGKFSWPDHLRLSLLMLTFGHMFFEQVYSVNDAGTEAHLKKLAPRMPSTIDEIKVAADGGLEWIKQRWTSEVGAPQQIPVSRLVAYVRNREGGNWLGQSILRPAYKNWLLKDRLLRVQAQTIERNGMGIPLYKAQEGATGSDIVEGKKMATLWRAGEAAGSAVPYGADLVLRGVEGTLPDANPAIRYHDEQIARAALAHFLNLGTQTGSWALGTTFADFFVYALQTLAQQIADVTTQHVIEDLVDLNFGEDEPAPRLVFDEIGSQQAATAQALKTLVDAGIIHPDQVLEESSRQQYGLPPADPASATPPPGQTAPTPPQPTQMGDLSVAAARRGRAAPAGVRARHRYNPAQLRDPGGEGGGRWVKSPAAVVHEVIDTAAGAVSVAGGSDRAELRFGSSESGPLDDQAMSELIDMLGEVGSDGGRFPRADSVHTYGAGGKPVAFVGVSRPDPQHAELELFSDDARLPLSAREADSVGSSLIRVLYAKRVVTDAGPVESWPAGVDDGVLRVPGTGGVSEVHLSRGDVGALESALTKAEAGRPSSVRTSAGPVKVRQVDGPAVEMAGAGWIATWPAGDGRAALDALGVGLDRFEEWRGGAPDSVRAAGVRVKGRRSRRSVWAKYNPSQLRDPGGEGGGRWIKNPADAVSDFVDELDLADRISLEPGDRLGSSSRVQGSGFDEESDGEADLNWAVVFTKEYGPEARLGITVPEESDEWDGDPNGRWDTTILDAESVGKLRTDIAAGVASADKAARDADAAWKAGKAPTDPKLIGDESVAAGEARVGADGADLQWRIDLTDDEPTSWRLDLAHDPDSSGVGYNPKAARYLLRTLGQIEDELRGPLPPDGVTAARPPARRTRTPRRMVRARYNPSQKRDPNGTWGDGVPGLSADLPELDLEGFDLASEVEGTFGTLRMGVDEAGDVRVAFHHGNEARALDLAGEEVRQLRGVLERLADERDDLPDDSSGVVDEEWFGFGEEHRVQLLGNGVISVAFGAEDGDPWELNLDPPDGGEDDAATVIGALGEVQDELAREVRAAAGVDTHPGGEQLKHYWLYGEGAAKWSTWTELYEHLRKYLKPAMAKRTAAAWYHERFGIWPGSDANRVKHGKPPRGQKVGPG